MLSSIKSKVVAFEVDRLMSSYQSPPPPVLTVLHSLSEGHFAFNDLAPVLADSASLRQKILRLANSAYFSPAEPITDLGHAAVVIGQRIVVGLAMSESLSSHFKGGTPGASYGYESDGLLQHSIAVATTGWALAEEFGCGPEVCGRVYAAGLFHDIGKVIIDQALQVIRRPLNIASSPDTAPGIRGLELKELGVAHEQISRRLVKKWGLPEPIPELIGSHHAVDLPSQEAAFLHFADYTVSGFGLGRRQDLNTETPLDERALAFFEDSPEFLSVSEELALRESARALAIIEGLRTFA